MRDNGSSPVVTGWHKSSRSQGAGGTCVEVGRAADGRAAVLHSRRPAGGMLLCSPAGWRAFVAGVRTDTFG